MDIKDRTKLKECVDIMWYLFSEVCRIPGDEEKIGRFIKMKEKIQEILIREVGDQDTVK